MLCYPETLSPLADTIKNLMSNDEARWQAAECHSELRNISHPSLTLQTTRSPDSAPDTVLPHADVES